MEARKCKNGSWNIKIAKNFFEHLFHRKNSRKKALKHKFKEILYPSKNKSKLYMVTTKHQIPYTKRKGEFQ